MHAPVMYGENLVRIEHVSDVPPEPAGAVRLGRAGGRIPYDGDAM
jgi:hypothetical protein